MCGTGVDRGMEFKTKKIISKRKLEILQTTYNLGFSAVEENAFILMFWNVLTIIFKLRTFHGIFVFVKRHLKKNMIKQVQ